MKLSLLQMCKRRWLEIAISRLFYAFVSAFIVLGAVLGPYGTKEELNLLGRLVLSIQINIVMWTLAILIAVPIRIGIQRFYPNRFVALIVACLSAGLAITPVLDLMLRNRLDHSLVLHDYLEHSILFFVLASIITYVTVQMSRQSAGGPVPDPSFDPVITHNDVRSGLNSPIQQRLPHDKRGELIALIAQDHYVEVVTERGKELVLMRLSDAISECAPKPGLQVHRSVWVSNTGVASMGREKRRSFAILTNGQEVPVARVNEIALKTMLSGDDSQNISKSAQSNHT